MIILNVPEISRRGQVVDMHNFHGETIPPWKPSHNHVKIRKIYPYKRILQQKKSPYD